MSETLTHPESQQDMPMPDGHVGIPIDNNLARLALIAVDGLNKLPGSELMKLQSMLQADFGGGKPTAKNVGAMFRIVGFTFATALDQARQQRVELETTSSEQNDELQEHGDASDDTKAN